MPFLDDFVLTLALAFFVVCFFFFFFDHHHIDRAGTQRRARHPQRPLLRRGPLHFCRTNESQPRDLLDQERCDSAFPKQHVWYGSIICQGTLLLFFVRAHYLSSARFSYPSTLCSLFSLLSSLFLSALGTSDVSCDNQDLIFAVSGNGSTFNTNGMTPLVPVRSFRLISKYLNPSTILISLDYSLFSRWKDKPTCGTMWKWRLCGTKHFCSCPLMVRPLLILRQRQRLCIHPPKKIGFGSWN